ncbi:MAG: peptidyl-prolyl cis-trans isomerase, partial [Thermoguttaceae bacterium]|nr:peptidyl-prolyl cis-trans isomerase [Thermoguttaceae bacterium]
EKIPEDVREAHRKEYKNGIINLYLSNEEIFTQILDNHIRKLLFYNDYVVSRPKDQIEEQTKQLETEFNAKMLPELKETFGCKTQKELEDYFEREIGSDYAQEKRIFMQQTLGELWMNYNLGEEDFDPTVVDLRRYYEANREVYRVQPRVRWQAMTVYFGRQRSKEEARRKIAHMGNAVQAEPDPKRQEALFAEVCRVDSEDVFASEGGYRDWTERGSLRSQIVENAIFSEDLPIGSLSRILEDESSLTIARIIERVPERVKSFTEVQEEVREKLIADRREAMRKIYEERLSKRFSIEIYAITPEEREKWFRSAERETESATGREIY